MHLFKHEMEKSTLFSQHNMLEMNHGKYLFQITVCQSLLLHVINRVWINDLISQAANRHVWPKTMQTLYYSTDN